MSWRDGQRADVAGKWSTADRMPVALRCPLLPGRLLLRDSCLCLHLIRAVRSISDMPRRLHRMGPCIITDIRRLHSTSQRRN